MNFIGRLRGPSFADQNGVSNKALFRLLLAYIAMHFKTIIQRKETNGFGDKAVLALQAQCASITLDEKTITQCDFTGMKIMSCESLSSYLHHFLVAWDNAEMAGNEYSNVALVDLFLSSLGTDNTAYYSILCTTLENQYADSQKISFADMELMFIQLEKCHTSNGSSHRERANLATLKPNPLAASNCFNSKTKLKGGNSSLITGRRLILLIVAVMTDPLYASVATNQHIKILNVLKRRRGIQPMSVQQEEELW